MNWCLNINNYVGMYKVIDSRYKNIKVRWSNYKVR